MSAAVAVPPGRVVQVDAPGLARSFAAGAARSAGAVALRRTTVRGVDLPTTRLRTSVVADPARLTAYQHLVGAPARDTLPAGFVHVLTFPLATALMVRRDFPLPLLGMVHVANDVTQHRPLELGEQLTVEVHASGLRAHRRGVTVELVARVWGAGDDVEGDEPSWRGTSTYLASGIRLLGADGAPVRALDEPRQEWLPPVPTGAWRLPSELGRSYAAVSGDHNPIHTSSLAAKAFGFPRTIAHGMYTAARALAVVDPRDDAYRWTARFHKPVLLPGTVSVAEVPAGADTVVEVWSGRDRRHLEVRVGGLR